MSGLFARLNDTLEGEAYKRAKAAVQISGLGVQYHYPPNTNIEKDIFPIDQYLTLFPQQCREQLKAFLHKLEAKDFPVVVLQAEEQKAAEILGSCGFTPLPPLEGIVEPPKGGNVVYL